MGSRVFEFLFQLGCLLVIDDTFARSTRRRRYEQLSVREATQKRSSNVGQMPVSLRWGLYSAMRVLEKDQRTLAEERDQT
jgi:hypothetical protein